MLIYDVGMHNGDDTDYYLTKGARVVAVEANEDLCASARQRFPGPIGEGRLIVLNLAVGETDGEADFFINDGSTVQSSLRGQATGTTRAVRVPLRRLSGLFAEHGTPDFAKIDVEHLDHIILRDLRLAGRLPAHISVEAHSFSVLEELIRAEFTRFRLVNCALVQRRFGKHVIRLPEGKERYGFRHHSSGPFGEDLPDSWLTSEQLMVHWLNRTTLLGKGWYDIHAGR